VRQPFAVCFHASPLYGSPGGDERYTQTDRDLHCEPDAHSRTKHGREPSV
jgi:hypothetical protein